MYHVVHLRTYNMKILRKGSSHELQEHWIGRIILPPLLNLIEWEALDWLQWWYVVHKDNRFRIIRSSFGIPWNCKEVWLDQYPTQYKSVELYIIVEVEIPTNRRSCLPFHATGVIWRVLVGGTSHRQSMKGNIVDGTCFFLYGAIGS